MTLKETILKQIPIELYDDSTIQIASIVFDYLKEGGDKITYISHGLLKNRIGGAYSDEEIILTARVLSTTRFPLLEECYEFIDGEIIRRISREIINESYFSGIFYNPETGEEVLNYQDYIRIYYVPSKDFLNALKDDKDE